MTSRPDDAVITTESRRALLVVAAGSGTRLGFGTPKAAVMLKDRTILDHALDAVTADLHLDLLVLVLPAEGGAHRQLAPAAVAAAAGVEAEVLIISGGASRPESVAAGSEAVSEHATLNSWGSAPVHVLIHDAATPPDPRISVSPCPHRTGLRSSGSCARSRGRRHDQTRRRGRPGSPDAAALAAACSPDAAGLHPDLSAAGRRLPAEPQGTGRVAD